jgi:hypothetical protein
VSDHGPGGSGGRKPPRLVGLLLAPQGTGSVAFAEASAECSRGYSTTHRTCRTLYTVAAAKRKFPKSIHQRSALNQLLIHWYCARLCGALSTLLLLTEQPRILLVSCHSLCFILVCSCLSSAVVVVRSFCLPGLSTACSFFL